MFDPVLSTGGPLNGLLVTTQLHIPRPRSKLVPRPRLSDRLAHSLAYPLAIISAPAGSGKTTLVSNLKSEISNLQFAWLSLDDDDNDPVRFWVYVIAALQTVSARIGTEAQALLQSPQPPSSKTILSSLLNGLVSLDQAKLKELGF